MLGVTETWTNADGSTGTATIADNVEAYAPGTPIFALSGNDTLTGAGGNDLFVFAQPIGNDTIYNFNAASDKIDLMGFASISDFSDVQSEIGQDSSGDAVITLGPWGNNHVAWHQCGLPHRKRFCLQSDTRHREQRMT